MTAPNDMPIGHSAQRASSTAALGDEVLVPCSPDEASQGPRLNNHGKAALAARARPAAGVASGDAMSEGLELVVGELSTTRLQ